MPDRHETGDVDRPPLDHSRIAARISSGRRFARFLEIVESTSSTNDLARARGGDHRNDGLVILAEHQTAGRGQQGRTWSAPPRSSILLSAVHFPPDSVSTPQFLTAWTALAVCKALESIGLIAVVRWPNDIYCQDRKICGILVERSEAAVIGIGVNFSTTADEFPSDLRVPATSVSIELGRNADRSAFAAELIVQMDECCNLSVENPSALFERWRRYAKPAAGEMVTATTRQTQVTGFLLDFSPDRPCRIERTDLAGAPIALIEPTDLLRIEACQSAGFAEESGKN